MNDIDEIIKKAQETEKNLTIKTHLLLAFCPECGAVFKGTEEQFKNILNDTLFCQYCFAKIPNPMELPWQER